MFHALGHDQAGKASASLRVFAVGLVKLGFVVLAIDPIGQGERRIFFDEQIRNSRVGRASMEHQMVGAQSLLGGESLARYMIWDALRGIDLLESLAEVDRSRIGATGCSWPSRSRDRSLIYVDQDGKSAGLDGGVADELARLGYAVLAIDVAGTGETASNWGRPNAWTTANQDIVWLALMVGRSLVGLQMTDILRGLDVLEEKRLLHNGRAIAVGRSLAAVSLLQAAAIDSRVESLAVEESLLSYRAAAESPIHAKTFEAVVPGVLSRYDLQDLVAAIAPRIACLVNLRCPLQQQALLMEAEAHYRFAREACRALGAEENLRIGLRRAGESLLLSCPEVFARKTQK